MFLRNAGIDLQVQTTSQHRRTKNMFIIIFVNFKKLLFKLVRKVKLYN
jgi:hypothetical protein